MIKIGLYARKVFITQSLIVLFATLAALVLYYVMLDMPDKMTRHYSGLFPVAKYQATTDFELDITFYNLSTDAFSFCDIMFSSGEDAKLGTVFIFSCESEKLNEGDHRLKISYGNADHMVTSNLYRHIKDFKTVDDFVGAIVKKHFYKYLLYVIPASFVVSILLLLVSLFRKEDEHQVDRKSISSDFDEKSN